MSERFVYELEADVFRMERRPHLRQVIVNDDYRGLRVLDPFKGEQVLRVGYGDEFVSEGNDDAWAICADGDFLVAFNDESQRGCLVSLEQASAQSVAHPPWRTTTGMPYDWRSDVLWLKDPEAFAFASFDLPTRSFETDDGMRALQTNRGWRRAIDRMRRLEASCLRVEPELAQALTIATTSDVTRIGRIGWVDQSEPSVSVPNGVTRLAMVEDSFVALYEYECVVLDRAGHVSRRITAPPGFHYVDVASFSALTDQPPALVIACQATDGRSLARISVHLL